MLARSRRLELGGTEIETPLLVPSISSKALGPIDVGLRKSELVAASVVHTETLLPSIDEAVLISAYDIHFRYIADPLAFRRRFTRSIYAGPRILIIDSGWYEKSIGPAAGQWYHEVGDAQTFELSDYTEVIDELDPNIRCVVVGWDVRGAYEEQMSQTHEFFASREELTPLILLRPEGKRQAHDFKNLSVRVARRLRSFGVIGVTEKELGDSLLNRLVTLAELRSRLDEGDVASPIHVFGGLDPMCTPLYVAAGGEIFDGLSWLRYAFREGLCIYRDAPMILDRQYQKRFPRVAASTQLANLDAISELTQELKVFVHNEGDWTKLRRGSELRPAFEAMEAKLGRSHGR